MNSRSCLLSSIFFALLPFAASAQDWSGAYGAVMFSNGGGDVRAPSTFDLDGQAYGIAVGYNVQSGNFVYGGELAYQKSEIDLVHPAPFKQRYESLLDLKGRFGYSSGPFLAYGVIGYSVNKYALTGATSDGGGFSYGLGADYKINDRMFVGAEYLMRDMHNDAVSGINALDANLSTVSLRFGMSF